MNVEFIFFNTFFKINLITEKEKIKTEKRNK